MISVMATCAQCNGPRTEDCIDSGALCDECQQKLLKKIVEAKPEEVLMGGSDQAVQGLMEAQAKGTRPNFRVTAADFREGGPTHFILAWETVSAGFGELTFFRKDGKLHIDTEGMGARFCVEVFEKMIEQTLPQEERMPRQTLNPQPYGNYEGHDLRRADMPVLWSVGASPRDAIEALCWARWGGTLENLGEALTGGDPLYTWGYRFTSDNGTSFKAAGIEIPGGFACTWWK